MPETHPSGDKCFKLLDVAMKKHQFQAHALLEVLHTAQALFGFLQADLLTYIARRLKLPPSRLFGVATSYHFFTFTPKGKHSRNVCLGTACYVKGAASAQGALEKELGVKAWLRDAANHLGLEEWFSEQTHCEHLADAIAVFLNKYPQPE